MCTCVQWKVFWVELAIGCVEAITSGSHALILVWKKVFADETILN